MSENRPRNVVPQDILEAMRQNDSELHSFRRVIELQQELIEIQRDTIKFQQKSIENLKEISSLKEEVIRILQYKLDQLNSN